MNDFMHIPMLWVSLCVGFSTVLHMRKLRLQVAVGKANSLDLRFRSKVHMP